jgi:hypothetical protein
VNVEKAVAFVTARGDPIQIGRMSSILWGQKQISTAIKRLNELQNEDGGYSMEKGGISTVSFTLNVMSWLDDLRIREGTLVDGAIHFLKMHQKNDSGWDEVEAVKMTNPPPFMTPGEARTRTWLTACCAHWLTRFGCIEPPGSKGCPASFLLKQREHSGLLKGYVRATWDALVLFRYYPGPDSAEFKETLKVIESAYRPSEYEASNLAWLLTCLKHSELPSTHPLVERALEELATRQRADGSWSSEDGERFTVGATVDALRVLKYFGRT